MTYHKTVTKHIISFKLFQLSVETIERKCKNNNKLAKEK